LFKTIFFWTQQNWGTLPLNVPVSGCTAKLIGSYAFNDREKHNFARLHQQVNV